VAGRVKTQQGNKKGSRIIQNPAGRVNIRQENTKDGRKCRNTSRTIKKVTGNIKMLAGLTLVVAGRHRNQQEKKYFGRDSVIPAGRVNPGTKTLTLPKIA